MLFDPAINASTQKPPRPAHLENRDLLCRSKPVDRPLGDFQVISDLPNGKYLALAGTG